MKLRFTRRIPRALALPGAILLLTAPHPVAHAQKETNPPPAEATASHPAQPSSSGFSVSAMNEGGWAVLSDVTGQLIDLNPGPAWNALVQSAKVAEEGDADLTTASDQYATIVRLFEELRPIAAEALYRYGLVEKKRQHDEEFRASHTRLIQWFPDFSDYVRKSLAARNDEATTSQPGKTSPPSGDHPSHFKMSPALAARYGLAPSTVPDPNASTPGAAELEMRRRYGLGGGRYGLGGGPSTESNPSSSAPMSPELMRRYGLTESPAALPEPTPASPSESAATESKRVLLDQQRTEILTELSRTQSELGKAQRELARFESMPPRQIPPNLVTDPRLRQLIEDASDPVVQANEEQGLARVNAMELYFQRIYLPRLQRTQEILMKESDLLRLRLDELIHKTKKLYEER